MFAVIRKAEPVAILRTCSTLEAAIIAVQLEKDKAPVSERAAITAVVLDDEGYMDIVF